MRLSFIKRIAPATCALVAASGITTTLFAQDAADAKAPAEKAAPANAGPKLQGGMKAPSIDLEGIVWVQGDPVKSLDEKGKVYMIECWATWCGPCVKSIPHLNELHKKFADKGLVVVGMNVFEDGLEKTQKFVEEQGEGMSYRVAYSGGRSSTFAVEWLKASDVNGIPRAYFVKDGVLLFHTHPASVDDTLIEKMLGDNFDAVAYLAEREAEEARHEKIQAKLGPLVAAGDWDKVAELAKSELSGESDKNFRNQLLTMVAINKGDWAAIAAVTGGMESEGEKEAIFGRSAFHVESGEGAVEAATAALKVFTAEGIDSKKRVSDKVMPGLVRARYLGISGDKEGALALLKSLSAEVASSSNERTKTQFTPILEKITTAAEAGGDIGPISKAMR